MAAKEAADMALKGEVKATSKDGYSIGTFAGGCFWCVPRQARLPIACLPFMFH